MGNYLNGVDEDRINWRVGGMDRLKRDSRKLGGIVELLRTNSIGQMTMVYRLYRATLG